MTCCQRYKEAIEWLHGWQGRSENTPWILQNLAISLHEMKRYAEGFQVSRDALQLTPDHSTAIHKLLVAFAAALAGDTRTLRRLAGEIREQEFSQYYQYLHELLNAMECVLVSPNNVELPIMQQAKRAIRRGLAVFPQYQQEAFLSYAHRQCLWTIAKTQSAFFPMTVFWWLSLL